MNRQSTPSRSWSLHLGNWLGIDVYLHYTFLLLLAFVGISYGITGGRQAAMSGVLFFVGLFLCVLMHEYGHALAARRYGIGTRDITLLPIGGVARLERMPDRPWQELVVALAGPAVNVVIAAVLFLVLALGGMELGISTVGTEGGLLQQLLAANLFLVLFNLLPAFPMDGGRVLRAVLAMNMNHARATRIAGKIGQGMAIIFGFAGLFGNPMLLLIALFVWVGAAQEVASAEMRNSFGGAYVRDAMLTDFRTLSPNNFLRDAVRLLLAGSQQDFPVTERERVVGILNRSDLFRALRETGDSTPVGEVMATVFATLKPDEPLENALASEKTDKGLAMLVLSEGRLVGIITAENIGEFFMIRSALHSRDGTPPPGGELWIPEPGGLRIPTR
ncbi:MAG: site-2 protease family protein [Verrucomicrobia bacterium]|nr:site-2 protease family protein [Verrucomicrobiota bacterium]